MIILGLNRGDHDASACVVRDGLLVSFINAERLTRKRHEGTRVWEAARYCLDAAGVSRDDVDLVVQNSYTKDLDAYDALIASKNVFSPDTEFVRQFPRVRTIPHHLAHAYCGVGLAPFEECAVLVVDGIGQHLPGGRAEAESCFHLRKGKLHLLHQRAGTLKPDGLGFHRFDSLGAVYSMVSSYLFGHWDYCGKVMGLAPYGRANPYHSSIVKKDGPRLSFDLGFLAQMDGRNTNPGANWQTAPDRSRQLAAMVQRELEESLLHLARWLCDETRSKHLVLTGGVALNCVANRRILVETPFERVFVTPPAGDEGIAIGCAFFGWHAVHRGAKRFSLQHPYYGARYADDRVRAALDREVLVQAHRPASLEADAARCLASGKVLGWFQGASAMGPRALGDRSILADPRDKAMREHLNRRVKHREPFRPYGAAVLAERAAEYFELSGDSPYMTFAVRVWDGKKKRIPAVVHVDGTCRIQTVRREDNPRLHRLLQAFDEQTGVPLVINTSFNRNGEPIVETPEDALRSFLNMELDALALGDWWVRRRFGDERKETAEWLLTCRVRTARAFEVVESRHPGAVADLSLRLPPADQGVAVALSKDVADLLSYADKDVSVREALRKAGLKRGSTRGTAALEKLTELHRLGVIRLDRRGRGPHSEAPLPHPRSPDRAMRSRR